MSDKVSVLTGGVGGAKLVLGLANLMSPGQITAIVNTGDDFRHLGLWVSPDIDTLLYTLSGKANLAQGWGREAESWGFMAALRSLGGEDWFGLGDGDLALHVLRSSRMADGAKLSEIITDIATRWNIKTKILPMSDNLVATMVDTDMGMLAFQRYFVEHRCLPVARAVHFAGAAEAKPAFGVIEAIMDTRNAAILIAPSNPFLSVDPILAVPGIKEALRNTSVPVVAVSPIIGGKAVKGPTAKLMAEFGLEVSSNTIARYYEGLIDGILIDDSDHFDHPQIKYARTDTLMQTLEDRIRVAAAALGLARQLRK